MVMVVQQQHHLFFFFFNISLFPSSPAGLVLPEANFLEPYGGIKQAMGKWPVLRCLTYDCVD